LEKNAIIRANRRKADCVGDYKMTDTKKQNDVTRKTWMIERGWVNLSRQNFAVSTIM